MRLRVGFLLADDFTLSAFANFVDVLRLAADDADRSRPILCNWDVLSDRMDTIRSSCGVRVQPNRSLREAGNYDYLVVVGGVMRDTARLNAHMLRFLHEKAIRTPLVGLCTGVFILQEAGLLKGYRCCVSWFHHQDFIDRFDTERPISDQIFVVDRDRLTCSGGQGAAHLAAFLVARHIGQSAAIKSLNIMMIDDAQAGERPQPGARTGHNPTDALVKRALLLMQQNIQTPLPLGRVAAHLAISRRTLERRFLADIGQSPGQAYLGLRLERALHTLRTTQRPVTEIALSCGFCDAPHLARTLRAEHGITPAQYRRGSHQASRAP
ncbi:GlxA family transcriptional regulator [Paracoccus sp. SCSIO 75233]|uniref:GlxA family transcriptional regulator n=1 Tax=Paracoccus sp. SCSIO 75233 TaxID=3017782 RepID=UPI0022F01A26|nr:GlxA family transcriptional regulator [Paracoccus sp. SCSIO 75233]WBU53070.1 GlxA family transcriptional regulator [Paracoccus sp. SCSIO 75233]